ncbi:MAG: hypothetical protein LBH54_01235 [Clostridiales bacterium]|nr:hypothetical protein [Clostridiales bacterium]
MRKNIVTVVAVFVIGMLVITAGFFLLNVEKTTLNLWAFGGLLFSLAVSLLSTVALILPKKNKDAVLYTAGLNAALWIYQAAAVVSVLFVRSFEEAVGGFILLQISINALFLIAVPVIDAASRRAYRNHAKTSENAQNGEYDKPKRGGF